METSNGQRLNALISLPDRYKKKSPFNKLLTGKENAFILRNEKGENRS